MENFEHKQASVERIVGNASSESKEAFFNTLESASREQNVHNEMYREYEVEKTSEQIVLFDLALKSVNQLRVQRGMPPLDWTSDNLHIFKPFRIEEKGIPNHDGIFLTNEQQVWIERSDLSNLGDIKKMTHELLHAAGYNALQSDYVPELDVNLINTYRSGLYMQERFNEEMRTEGRKPKEYFRNWNEAVIEGLTKQLCKEYRHSLLSQDRHDLESEIGAALEYSSYNPPTREELEDLAYVYGDAFFGGGIAKYSYGRPRKIYATLYEKLYLANKTEYTDASEIKDLAVKAVLTGNILPLGKLIDKTFGKGTFRAIGEADADIEKLEQLIGTLTPTNTN